VHTALAAPDEALHFSRVAGAGGVPLNVVESGPASAPGLLFVHGFGQTYLSFEAQLTDPDLRRDFHLVAFDLRGHGNSGKPWAPADYRSEAFADDVAAVLRATNLRRPVLVAWSFGGLAAMDYIRHYGSGELAGINLVGTVARLVLPPAADDADAPPVPSDRVRWMLSDNLADNLRSAEQTLDLLTARRMPDAWRARTLAAAMTMPSYARRAIGAPVGDNADLAARIRIPVLISAGVRDPISTVATAAPAAAALPEGSTSLYPESGHSPFAEEPARFNRELASFARTAGAGRPAADRNHRPGDSRSKAP
jgi:pimeloyl-ACP methyl ester carboxylesterase